MSDVIDHSDISVAGEVNYLVSSRDSLGYPISQTLGKIVYFPSPDEFTKSIHPAINEKISPLFERLSCRATTNPPDKEHTGPQGGMHEGLPRIPRV